jgi:hypothetical protein
MAWMETEHAARPPGSVWATASIGSVVPAVAAVWLERDHVVARLGALARGMAALDLRQARILAWLRAQDLAPLGFPGWLAFTREHADWAGSWIRSLVHLVRSGLTEVMRAVCNRRLPLAVAVRAPGMCDSAGQSTWIDAAIAGQLPARKKRRPSGASALVEPDEADTIVIWHARQKMRRLEGLPLSDREADGRMLVLFREKRPADEVLEAAFAPAPKPATAPADVPGVLDWDFADPADPLVGPWHAPGSSAEGLERLHAVQEARRVRVIELGERYEKVVREGLHRRWGYRDVESFCQATMGLSARSLQRYRELGRGLRRLPELAEAARSGMSLSRVEAVARIATDDDVARWVGVAARTPLAELERVAAHVAAGADTDALLDAYEAAMTTTGPSTTDKVALASIQAPVPPPLTDRVHPDLAAAARWLLAIPVPPQRGFGKVKERDRFICANPECRRPAYRNHAHHGIFRRNGGTDDPWNGYPACPSCHLRLLHTGIVTLERRGDTVIWTFPGRTVTVVSGPVL